MVVPALEPAGMENVVARLGRGLCDRGHDVGFTCIEFAGRLGEDLVQHGYRVKAIPSPGIRTILFPIPLTRWFRSLQPDVVHTHSGAWLKAARAAAHAGVPRIIHTIHGLHDVEPWFGPALKRFAARYTAVTAAVSEPLHHYLRDQVGLPADRLCTILNGVDTDAFVPGPRSGAIRQSYSLPSETVVVGHVARFSPVKDHQTLVRAFATLTRSRPEAFLALAGDGPLRPAVERLTNELGISHRVAFLGHRTDVLSVYRDIDVFVLPSLAEGTSMSILEAMACGVAVVATAVGGTPDLLADGAAGMLVRPGDADGLAGALDRVVGDAEVRARFAQAARSRAMARYSHADMLNAYERLYGAPTIRPPAAGRDRPCVESPAH